MGCQSSKDTKAVITHIKKQDQKINNLIQINQALQQKLTDLQMNTLSEGKHSLETNDLTNLIDARFNKLEKTVEKMHHDVKAKLFEGITDNLDKDSGVRNDKSLSLNFAQETNPIRNSLPPIKDIDPQWKDLLDESNDLGTRVTIEKALPKRFYPEHRRSSKSIERVAGIVNHNQIQIEMDNIRVN